MSQFVLEKVKWSHPVGRFFAVCVWSEGKGDLGNQYQLLVDLWKTAGKSGHCLLFDECQGINVVRRIGLNKVWSICHRIWYFSCFLPIAFTTLGTFWMNVVRLCFMYLNDLSCRHVHLCCLCRGDVRQWRIMLCQEYVIVIVTYVCARWATEDTSFRRVSDISLNCDNKAQHRQCINTCLHTHKYKKKKKSRRDAIGANT